jgi:NAD(P)-dependent dehydrogenase (short-subunit alcohol dehydrogenase family)
MPRKLKNAVVVITGASSGIGRATALGMARRGAALVLAARGDGPLGELVQACAARGGHAIAVPTDVTDQQAVELLATRALEQFGRIDVWLNNAAVMAVGRFEDTPPEVFRRVLETNLFGYVYGARAALRSFRRQGYGVLINVGSLDSRLSQPYASAYVTSKQAVRGFSMSLRQELALDDTADIHVCTVMPATIDTPIYQHAANFAGRVVKAMPPVYPAERVARAIMRCAERPRRETFVGTVAHLLDAQSFVLPGFTERFLALFTDKQLFHRGRSAAPTSGNLFAPMAESAHVSGGWQSHSPRDHLLTNLGLAARVALTGVGAWRRPSAGRVHARSQPLQGGQPRASLAGYHPPGQRPGSGA